MRSNTLSLLLSVLLLKIFTRGTFQYHHLRMHRKISVSDKICAWRRVRSTIRAKVSAAQRAA